MSAKYAFQNCDCEITDWIRLLTRAYKIRLFLYLVLFLMFKRTIWKLFQVTVSDTGQKAVQEGRCTLREETNEISRTVPSWPPRKSFQATALQGSPAKIPADSLSWGDKTRVEDSGRPRQLEFAGWRTREDGASQRKSFRKLQMSLQVSTGTVYMREEITWVWERNYLKRSGEPIPEYHKGPGIVHVSTNQNFFGNSIIHGATGGAVKGIALEVANN